MHTTSFSWRLREATETRRFGGGVEDALQLVQVETRSAKYGCTWPDHKPFLMRSVRMSANVACPQTWWWTRLKRRLTNGQDYKIVDTGFLASNGALLSDRGDSLDVAVAAREWVDVVVINGPKRSIEMCEWWLWSITDTSSRLGIGWCKAWSPM